MEDSRDKLIPAQLAGYTWELSGYLHDLRARQPLVHAVHL